MPSGLASSFLTRRGRIAASAVWLALLLPGAIGGAQEPNKFMLDDPLAFSGTETLEPGTGELVIGLFASDDPQDRVSRDVVRGAELAVELAKLEHGDADRSIRLVHRWAGDPWAGGAREVVRMVFADRAWVVIGGSDGDTTHVIQQVATKAHVPIISPVSGDPSLTHTRVPWIFRLPPSDDAQARVLVRDGLVKAGALGVVLVTSTDHDGRTFATALRSALKASGVELGGHLEAPFDADLDGLAERAVAFQPEVVVVRLESERVRPFLASIARVAATMKIALPWIPGLDLRSFPPPPGITGVVVTPFSNARRCGPQLKLERAYIRRWGVRPSPSATYGYDAVRLVVEACRRGATGRRELRQQLADLDGHLGASGVVAWDAGGGNVGAPEIAALPIRHSRPPR